MLNLTKYQKADVVAEVILQSYWAVNEDHIKEWIKEWFKSDGTGDYPNFDQFLDEFDFDGDYPGIPAKKVFQGLLQFIDYGGYTVIDQLLDEFESAFIALCERAYQEMLEEDELHAESQLEYREVAGW